MYIGKDSELRKKEKAKPPQIRNAATPFTTARILENTYPLSPVEFCSLYVQTVAW